MVLIVDLILFVVIYQHGNMVATQIYIFSCLILLCYECSYVCLLQFDFVDAHQKMLLSEKDYCIYAASVGVTEELDRPSGSGSSEDSGCSSRKRPRKEGLGGGGFFDLNLPAEFVDRN